MLQRISTCAALSKLTDLVSPFPKFDEKEQGCEQERMGDQKWHHIVKADKCLILRASPPHRSNVDELTDEEGQVKDKEQIDECSVEEPIFEGVIDLIQPLLVSFLTLFRQRKTNEYDTECSESIDDHIDELWS